MLTGQVWQGTDYSCAVTSILLFQGFVGLVINLVLLAVKIFALIDSVLHTQEEYRAAMKWSKTGWVILLGVGVALQFWPIGGGIINIAMTIAAFVYLADVRPAIKNLRRR